MLLAGITCKLGFSFLPSCFLLSIVIPYFFCLRMPLLTFNTLFYILHSSSTTLHSWFCFFDLYVIWSCIIVFVGLSYWMFNKNFYHLTANTLLSAGGFCRDWENGCRIKLQVYESEKMCRCA